MWSWILDPAGDSRFDSGDTGGERHDHQFADPAFPPPRFSVYEDRKHVWTAVLGDDVEHHH